ncbi:MAG TPA: dihydroneopterin aldolase [Flavobacteriales bacterium]|jgi:dihydroneopterin aldolase|nr:dihydroneopterin aldolase [Flavobacteriales bacterium]HIB78197.1 dihydroneopterin aldolase [Flavobacteriales bacterium]HIN41073.1 dihydroneopterin aldolase [Flavobacteriales bacterium]HIO58967.1 dihydroneopterin aldolase [Flavobacteriales bacterium]
MSSKKFEIIEVSGLRFHAYHGCMAEETKIGGEYRIDVRLEVDMIASGKSDFLSDTIDYCAVHKIVAEEMAIPSKLIEHVGRRIAESLKNGLPLAKTVKIKLTKFSPPIDGDCESVAVIMRA